MITSNWLVFMKFLNTRKNNWIIIVCDSELSDSRFIDRFFEFFIKNTVLLSCQIRTAKAVLTTDTRSAKSRIAAIRTILRIVHIVAFIAVETFVAVIIFRTKIYIQTVF